VVALKQGRAVPTDGKVDEPAATRVALKVGGEVIRHTPAVHWCVRVTECN